VDKAAIKPGIVVDYNYSEGQKNTGAWTGTVIAIDEESGKTFVRWTVRDGKNLKRPQLQLNRNINLEASAMKEAKVAEPVKDLTKKAPAAEKKAAAPKAEVKAEAVPAEAK